MRRPDTAINDAKRSGTHVTEPQFSTTRSGPALRCATCGYAIASYGSVPNCPMCHTRRWIMDRHASHPGRRLT